jgi:hypothetical protein
MAPVDILLGLGGGGGLSLYFESPPEEDGPRTLVPVWDREVLLRGNEAKYAWHCPSCKLTLMTDVETT